MVVALHESDPDLELAPLLALLDPLLDGRQLLAGLEGDEGRQRTPEHEDEAEHASDDAGSSLDRQVRVWNRNPTSGIRILDFNHLFSVCLANSL